MLRFIRSNPLRCGTSGSLQTPNIPPHIFDELLERLRSLNQVSIDQVRLVHSECRGSVLNMSSVQLVDSLEILSSIRLRDRSLGLVGEIFRSLITANKWENLSSNDCVRLITLCGKMRVFDSELFKLMEDRVELSSIGDFVRVINALNRIQEFSFFKKSIANFIACNASSIVHSDVSRVVIPLMRYAVGSSSHDMIPLCLDAFHTKVESIRSDKDLLVSRSVVSSGDVYIIVTLLGKLSRQLELEGESFALTESASSDIMYCCKSIVSYELRNWDLERLLRFFFAISKLHVFDDFFVRRRLVPAISYTFNAKTDKTDEEKELVKVMIKQLPFRNQMIEDLETLVSNSN